MKVQVAADFNAYWGTYYLAALGDWTQVVPEVPSEERMICIALSGVNIAIIPADRPPITEKVRQWAHIIAATNTHLAPDAVPMPPFMPIRAWGPAHAGAHMLRSWSLAPRTTWRQIAANYYRQYKYRLPEDHYVPGRVDPNYVFSAHSLWVKALEINQQRASFMRLAQRCPRISFEGGFNPRRLGATFPEYDDVTSSRYYGHRDYIQNTRRSAVVFCTSGLHGNHSWKLAEFLALGKAIIATPPLSRMPVPLEHGVHWHQVDGSHDSVRDGLDRLLSDEPYRRQLERNARKYYELHIAPAAIVLRIRELAGV